MVNTKIMSMLLVGSFITMQAAESSAITKTPLPDPLAPLITELSVRIPLPIELLTIISHYGSDQVINGNHAVKTLIKNKKILPQKKTRVCFTSFHPLIGYREHNNTGYWSGIIKNDNSDYEQVITEFKNRPRFCSFNRKNILHGIRAYLPAEPEGSEVEYVDLMPHISFVYDSANRRLEPEFAKLTLLHMECDRDTPGCGILAHFCTIPATTPTFDHTFPTGLRLYGNALEHSPKEGTNLFVWGAIDPAASSSTALSSCPVLRSSGTPQSYSHAPVLRSPAIPQSYSPAGVVESEVGSSSASSSSSSSSSSGTASS